MNEEIRKEIENQIGYEFENPMLLQQAFTRCSYCREHQGYKDNEVLEFIGDKVLDVLVVKELDAYFGEFNDDGEYVSEKNEGKLTNLKQKLVNSKMLASRIEMTGFQDYLIMGKGDIRNQVQEDTHVKEDLFEAILGAVAIDSDWNFEKLEEVMEQMLDVEYYIENGFDDSENYVALVQEWSLKEYGELPEYKYLTWRGNMGMRYFSSTCQWGCGQEQYTCELILPNGKRFISERQERKSYARMNAACMAYEFLDENDMLFTLRNEVGDPDSDRAVSQLHELWQKGYIEKPEYEFEEAGYDEDGNPLWECTCSVPEQEYYYTWVETSKKNAKKGAAYLMVQYIMDGEMDEDDEQDENTCYGFYSNNGFNGMC